MIRCLLSAWFACGVANTTDISVVDDTGRELVLKQAASRIVTLSPHATELVYAAGAGGRLVAVAAYSDHPTAATLLPSIGGAGGMDKERLLQLRPDLVVAWHSGTRAGDLRWLARQGIAVYRSEPAGLNEIAAAIRKLGRLAGTSSAAQQAAAHFEAELAEVCPAKHVVRRAYYQLWDQPALTYGGNHWANDALWRAGYRNVFGSLDRELFSPTRESVLISDPDIVLASALTQVDARYAKRLLRVPDSLDRPTPRILNALRRLCQAKRTAAR